MIKVLIIIAIIAAVSYLAYITGYMTLNMKSAITFVSQKASNKSSARFTSCDGYMKRILRFPDDRNYVFNLTSELKKGNLSVELLDSSKNLLFTLSGNQASANVNIKAGKPYCLIVRFDNTSGNYSLVWNVNRDNNVL